MTLNEAIKIVDPREIGNYAGFVPGKKPLCRDFETVDMIAAITVVDELKKRQWISVEDILPDKWKDVLILVQSSRFSVPVVRIGRVDQDNNWYVLDGMRNEYRLAYRPFAIKPDWIVTHWQLMPEPPEL